MLSRWSSEGSVVTALDHQGTHIKPTRRKNNENFQVLGENCSADGVFGFAGLSSSGDFLIHLSS